MSARTKAFVNLFAAMGTLEKYVEYVPEAKEVARQQDVVVRFKVKDGPDGIIDIKDGNIRVYERENNERADIVLPCKSPEFFNDVVDGKATPIPSLPGIFKALKFMGKPESPFNVLTEGMTAILRRTEFANEEEKKVTTVLSFYAMVNAIVQIGNNDRIAKFAMRRLEDGEISMGIRDVCYATIIKKDGRLRSKLEQSTRPRAFMTFADVDTAWALISGEGDAMSFISSGTLETSGQMLLLDNLNKILNFVPKYLQ